jgi:hypothetical protein
MLPFDTLGHHRERPVKKKLDLSSVPVGAVSKKAKAYTDKPMVEPVHEAAWFYVYSQADQAIAKQYHPLEPLPQDVLDIVIDRMDHMNRLATRMFYYLLVVCTREARHEHGTLDYEFMSQEFGPEASTFHQSIKSSGEQGAVGKLYNHPPLMGLGAYTRSLQHIFYKGGFNGGYGGPKWGSIADCLASYATGQTTGEEMIDTAFTLEHNGGAMFNKNVFFSFAHSQIHKILDVQRSGQVPALMMAPVGQYPKKYIPEGILEQILKMRNVLGEDFIDRAYVDWYKVMALGSIHDYWGYTTAQKEVHGDSQWEAQAEKMKNKPAKQNVPDFNKMLATKEPAWTKETHFILPGQLGALKKLARAA